MRIGIGRKSPAADRVARRFQIRSDSRLMDCLLFAVWDWRWRRLERVWGFRPTTGPDEWGSISKQMPHAAGIRKMNIRTKISKMARDSRVSPMLAASAPWRTLPASASCSGNRKSVSDSPQNTSKIFNISDIGIRLDSKASAKNKDFKDGDAFPRGANRQDDGRGGHPTAKISKIARRNCVSW